MSAAYFLRAINAWGLIARVQAARAIRAETAGDADVLGEADAEANEAHRMLRMLQAKAARSAEAVIP